MKALLKVLAGGAGLAALASAAPAAAQYYPAPGYGYGNNNNVVGQVLGQILNPYGGYNYGNYGGNDRMLIDRCAGAVSQRINARYGGYQRYGQPYGYDRGYGYGYGYNNYGYGSARVLGITRVERRNYGIRVRGVATAGGGYGYNNPYGYNQYNQSGEFTFKCNVDYRGRITDIDLDRNRYAYRRY